MTITFDSERHAELVAVLSAATQSVEDILDELDGEAVALRRHWSGEAQDAYNRAHSAWSRSLDSLRGALGATARSSGRAGARLAQADRDAAEVWR